MDAEGLSGPCCASLGLASVRNQNSRMIAVLWSSGRLRTALWTALQRSLCSTSSKASSAAASGMISRSITSSSAPTGGVSRDAASLSGSFRSRSVRIKYAAAKAVFSWNVSHVENAPLSGFQVSAAFVSARKPTCSRSSRSIPRLPLKALCQRLAVCMTSLRQASQRTRMSVSPL